MSNLKRKKKQHRDIRLTPVRNCEVAIILPLIPSIDDDRALSTIESFLLVTEESARASCERVHVTREGRDQGRVVFPVN